MGSEYYCKECNKNHLYQSKIGKKHLRYRTIIIKRKKNNVKLELDKKTIEKKQLLKKTEKSLKIIDPESNNKKESSKNLLSTFIEGYQESYRKGIEMFGIWWKIFQISIWSIVMIFLITASIIFTIFLPKIEMIHWALR